jgi:hypothetical protein
VICPYCGAVQLEQDHCDMCGGLFEPLSRQASQNQMGPWYVREPEHPFRPGCNYLTLKRLAERGLVNATTILRGPTTNQFWAPATRTPGVAHLLGVCHNCAQEVEKDEYSCTSCGAVFTVPQDRQHLGLGSIRLLPGNAPPDVVAESTRTEASPDPTSEKEESTVLVTQSESSSGVLAEGSAASAIVENETIARQATRDDDTPVIRKATNRRLRYSLTRLRWTVGVLILLNIVLLLVLLVASNPRLALGFGGQSDSTQQGDGPSDVASD